MLEEPGISAPLGVLFFLTLQALKAWPSRLFQFKFHTSVVEIAGFAKGKGKCFPVTHLTPLLVHPQLYAGANEISLTP